MTRYLKSIKYILIILIIALIEFETQACSCDKKSTFKNEIRSASVIFVGTVVNSEEIKIFDTLDQRYKIKMKYTLIIDNIYKGQCFNDTMYVFTGKEYSDCGFNFQIGKKYIVYGRNLMINIRGIEQIFIDGKPAVYTSICTRTRLYQKREIKKIKKYLKKVALMKVEKDIFH